VRPNVLVLEVEAPGRADAVGASGECRGQRVGARRCGCPRQEGFPGTTPPCHFIRLARRSAQAAARHKGQLSSVPPAPPVESPADSRAAHRVPFTIRLRHYVRAAPLSVFKSQWEHVPLKFTDCFACHGWTWFKTTNTLSRWKMTWMVRISKLDHAQ